MTYMYGEQAGIKVERAQKLASIRDFVASVDGLADDDIVEAARNALREKRERNRTLGASMVGAPYDFCLK